MDLNAFIKSTNNGGLKLNYAGTNYQTTQTPLTVNASKPLSNTPGLTVNQQGTPYTQGDMLGLYDSIHNPQKQTSTSSSPQKYTEAQALAAGLDFNKLRQQGLADIPSIDPLTQEVDRAYTDRLSSLSNIEGLLRGALPTYQADAQSAYNTGLSTLDAGKAASTREINASATDAQARRDDALAAARQSYNELLRAGQQRFGAGTAGQAYSEIANVEAQKQFGSARQSYDQAMTKISDYKAGLEERYTTGLMQLQAQRDQAINQAQRDLNNQLIEIERMRGEAADAKASRRLAVLQDYRNNVFQVNQNITQMQTQLQSQLALANQQADQYAQQFAGLGMNAADAAGGVINDASFGLPVAQTNGSAGQGLSYIGQISPNKDQMVGYADPLSYARSQYQTLNA